MYMGYLLMSLFAGSTRESGVRWPRLLENCWTDVSISGVELTTDVLVEGILSAADLLSNWPK